MKRRRNRRDIILSVIFLALILSMVIYIWIYNYINLTVVEVEELKRVRANLEAQNRILRFEIANLSRADRIKRIATSELSMFVPVPETLVVVIENSNKNRR